MIEIRDLVKTFGAKRAVDGITFRVDRGEVLGFLGPNGAGKSTTMRIITGFVPLTEGSVMVGGKDVSTDPVGVREQIGYLPESAPSYSEMTVTEFLNFMADVRGIRGAERERRIGEISELTALGGVEHQIIDTLSKGFRQRVCFAQALIHDPPVLILDEPTDGLDPNQKHEMREVIRRMSRDKTIILSTHILEEMEAVCTRAIIIAQGKIVMDGTPQEMAAMSRFHKAVRVTVREPGEARLTDGFKGLNGVSEVSVSRDDDDEGMVIYHVFPEKNRPILQEVIHFLEKKKVAPESLASEPGRVDEVFRDVTQETF